MASFPYWRTWTSAVRRLIQDVSKEGKEPGVPRGAGSGAPLAWAGNELPEANYSPCEGRSNPA